MRKCIVLSVLMLLLIGGCQGSGDPALKEAELERIAIAQKIELVEAAGGLVLMVGGETITSDEIIESQTELGGVFVLPMEDFKPLAQVSELEQFKERARSQFKEVLMAKILSVLLYQQAREQAGENIDENLEKAAESEYRRLVLDYGGDQTKADEALKKRKMDRKSFKEQQKRAILIQMYVTSKLPENRLITYRELIDCYDQIKDEFFSIDAKITLRLIDIQPARLQMADPNEDRLELAKELADKLLARIEAGEDFGELAKQFSHGGWREFGGLWPTVRPTSLAAPYDILAAEAQKIDPGQVAGPIETKEHIFIMKLEDKQSAGYEPFEKVQRQVENKILIERRSEVFNKFQAKLIRQAELGRTDEFLDFCLEKIYRISNQ